MDRKECPIRLLSYDETYNDRYLFEIKKRTDLGGNVLASLQSSPNTLRSKILQQIFFKFHFMR